MRDQEKIREEHRARKACVYIRQSSPGQVLHHPESARRQRDLKNLAAGLGWLPSRIEILDDDQGMTAQEASRREAFKRVVGEVSVGEVGIVLGLEVSRLARNNADWFPLIEMCALTHTLVGDEEGVYDPNDPNDRLLLGLKGTFSEAELVRIKARLHGARWSLARRGELRRKIPVGYAWDEQSRVVLEPDERVRAAVADFFARFEQIGSACGVVRSYGRDGLVFPGRDRRSRWDAAVQWRPLSFRRATLMLHNPFYAGVYCYGERRHVTILDPTTKTRKTVVRRQPREEWVFRQDAHPAYITYDQYLRNQERLRSNWNQTTGPGAVRSGSGLLQGIVHCSRCGRQMQVRYRGRKGHPYYICTGRNTKTGVGQYCMSVPGQRLDGWVEAQVLEAIQPLGIEAALEAVSELEKRAEDLKRQWEHHIEQADYEAALAQRRYRAVDPDNRLVAANLERDWEQKLRTAEEVRREYAERLARPPMRISEEDRQRLRDLARNLPRLWRANSTSQSDRAKVVRILIREVWLSPESEPRRAVVKIHWQTGAVTEGFVPRPPASLAVKTSDAVVERVRQLRASTLTAAEIADQLNREALRTGRDNVFTARRVFGLLKSRKIRHPKKDPLR